MMAFLPPLAAQTGAIDSQVFRWEEAPLETTATGERRQILEGSSTHFSWLEVHATTLEPGTAPHASHSHSDQEELIIVKSGLIQVSIAGDTQLLGPGSIALAIPGDEHGIFNAGDETATYYVMRYRSRAPMDTARARAAGGSFMVDFTDLEFHETGKGGVRRYFNRPTAMCEYFEMHVTTLNEGLKSHDPHTHLAEEIILMMKGSTEEQIEDGFHPATVGDLIFLASDIPHAIQNTGKGQAQYFAFQWR